MIDCEDWGGAFFMVEIPLGLKNSLESGDCILFVGAGVGDHLLGQEGKPSPNATKLAEELAEQFEIDADGDFNLAKISQIVELRKGRSELLNFLKRRFAEIEPDEYFRWLFTIKWRAIYTTNYDFAIQRSFELASNPPRTPVTISLSSEMVDFNPLVEVPVYHLHGTLFGPSKPAIVITEDDYIRFRNKRRMLFEKLKQDFATSSILYVGYSNRDPNWKLILSELKEEFYPSCIPKSYRISPSTASLDAEILKGKDNIETIHATLKEFVSEAQTTLSSCSSSEKDYEKIKNGIPTDLMPIFEKYRAGTTRFVAHWTYVNGEGFSDKPNVKEFLRGDSANWSLIESKEYFERDVEEEIYEEILDYITSDRDRPIVFIVLAPAGYGVNTLLKIISVRLVKDQAGPVCYLKPGQKIQEGDIEFASENFGDAPFFVVSNAADHSQALLSSVHRLRDQRRPAVFLLGERLNEWRQRGGKLRGKEFYVEQLSDPEIHRLLDYLKRHGELNQLEPLSRELQFAAIKKTLGKELLVALREATEGKSFDAILEDEFRGIEGELSRKLYLLVSFFHLHGAYARDNLLGSILDVPITEIYSKTKDATEGVVIYDCLDNFAGLYGARTRHRTIANIVWERCRHDMDSELIIQDTLSKLNLNYQSDVDAFNHFVRSERIVDSIKTLDGKIKFFETACKKDPSSPYVRQHYARMLAREKRFDLALSQIETAIRMDPSIKVLYHTKGLILMNLAFEIESKDIARRRLVQSESSFRKGLSYYRRDEYCYQGLARLYIGWANRSSGEEFDEYIQKAEEVISEGLKVVNVRNTLWQESARVQELLGNCQGSIDRLSRAVRANPASAISRFLLARSYRKSGNPDKALEVLEPIINDHLEEFRIITEYALSMYFTGKPYDEIIAVLRLSTLYGYSDPRFISILGGLLFMNGDFSKSEEVFQESRRRDFTALEINALQFLPVDKNNRKDPMRINGEVVTVKAGFSFIDAEDYPRILCPGSKYQGLLMEKGMKINFRLAFCPKGAVAIEPQKL